MKDQFIEKDGLLFLRCEPEPLEIDKHGKSLVRYIQDDTRMGLYNKEAVCEEKALEKVLLYEPRNIYIAGDHHTRFEVIAKHCPEGSREWALWKILNGEMVHMSGFPYKALNGKIYCTNSAGEIYPATSYQLWLENKAKDGWQIYKEPKPQYKVGDWVEWCGDQYMVESAPPQSGDRYNIRSPYDELGCSVYPKNITRKLSPSEVIVKIGCLSGTVRPVSTNGTHIWFHLVGVDDKTIATIRISSLDKEPRKLVEGLLKAQEEEK